MWGKQVPAGTDSAALPLIGGVAGTQDQINALHGKVPTFMHIRNDPQVCDSEGLDWFEWTPARRAGAIENVASKQRELDVGYMYPLFFPLTATAECAAPGAKQVAYDAAVDGQLAKMRNPMDRYQYRPGR